MARAPWPVEGQYRVHSSSRERGQDYCLSICGDKIFAIPLADLFKVIRLSECARRDDLPAPLIGAAPLGEKRVPVARLETWLDGLAANSGTSEHVLLIDTGDGPLGLAVDRVHGIAAIPAGDTQPPTPIDPAVIGALARHGSHAVYVLAARAFAPEARSWRDQASTLVAASRARAPSGSARRSAFCFFRRRGRDFAVPVLAAREVVGGEALTPVPQAPDHVLGVVNLRGNLLALINPDQFLGLPVSAATATYEALVLESDDVQVGFLVDRVGDIATIDLDQIRPPSAALGGVCRGVWPTPAGEVQVLDVDVLVASATSATAKSFARSLPAWSGLEEGSDGVANVAS